MIRIKFLMILKMVKNNNKAQVIIGLFLQFLWLVFLTSLIILLSSCHHKGSGVQFEIPSEPYYEMIPWEPTEAGACLNMEGLKALNKNRIKREGYKEKLIIIIDSCNTVIDGEN